MWGSSLPEEVERAAHSLGLTLAVVVASTSTGSSGHRAGRVAAVRALRAMGSSALEVGRAKDGRALWPAGTTGSISHAAGLALAATSPSGRAVGIDLEVSGSLPAADARFVFDADEFARVTAAIRPNEVSTQLWSAKEAAFKAWSTALGGLPDVDPIDIRVESLNPLRIQATGALGRRVDPMRSLLGASFDNAEWVVTMVVDRVKGATRSAT